MARVTREESKAVTRRRLIDEARRLFREGGYAATSLEQIAEAASVTKGAIYGHFESKEDLLLSAVEDAPSPDYGTLLDDRAGSLRERLERYGRAMAVDPEVLDARGFAVSLEFLAALLRNDVELSRYADDVRRRLAAVAEEDSDVPLGGVSPLQVWALGHALFVGLQLFRLVVPDVVTPDVCARAFALLAGLYPAPASDDDGTRLRP